MRIKRGTIKRAKHKKVLEKAKGYRMTYSRSYRRAKEAMLHAGQYEYAHRRHRGAQIKVEWIKVISAALVNTELNYSKFIGALKSNKIEIDRKNLAELVVYNRGAFDSIVSGLK